MKLPSSCQTQVRSENTPATNEANQIMLGPQELASTETLRNLATIS